MITTYSFIEYNEFVKAGCEESFESVDRILNNRCHDANDLEAFDKAMIAFRKAGRIDILKIMINALE